MQRLLMFLLLQTLPLAPLLQPLTQLLQTLLPLVQLFKQRRLALRIQRRYLLPARLQGCQFFPLQLAALVGGHRQLGVELGTGHALQQRRPLIDAGLQEGGKLPLRQDHRAPKLLPIETHLLIDQLLHIPLVAGVQLLAGEALQRALLLLVFAVGTIARPTQLPTRPPDLAIDADEIDLGKAAGLAAAQDMPHVIGLEPIGILGAADLRLVLLVGDKARHLIVKRQTDGIEQGALAGAGIAGDGKQPGTAEHALGKVDGKGMTQTGQVFSAQSQNFHDACS